MSWLALVMIGLALLAFGFIVGWHLGREAEQDQANEHFWKIVGTAHHVRVVERSGTRGD